MWYDASLLIHSHTCSSPLPFLSIGRHRRSLRHEERAVYMLLVKCSTLCVVARRSPSAQPQRRQTIWRRKHVNVQMFRWAQCARRPGLVERGIDPSRRAACPFISQQALLAQLLPRLACQHTGSFLPWRKVPTVIQKRRFVVRSAFEVRLLRNGIEWNQPKVKHRHMHERRSHKGHADRRVRKAGAADQECAAICLYC